MKNDTEIIMFVDALRKKNILVGLESYFHLQGKNRCKAQNKCKKKFHRNKVLLFHLCFLISVHMVVIYFLKKS